MRAGLGRQSRAWRVGYRSALDVHFLLPHIFMARPMSALAGIELELQLAGLDVVPVHHLLESWVRARRLEVPVAHEPLVVLVGLAKPVELRAAVAGAQHRLEGGDGLIDVAELGVRAHGIVEDRLLLAEGELRGLGAVASHAAPAHLQRTLEGLHRRREVLRLVLRLRVLDGCRGVRNLHPLRFARELVHAGTPDLGDDGTARGDGGGAARGGSGGSAHNCGGDGDGDGVRHVDGSAME